MCDGFLLQQKPRKAFFLGAKEPYVCRVLLSEQNEGFFCKRAPCVKGSCSRKDRGDFCVHKSTIVIWLFEQKTQIILALLQKSPTCLLAKEIAEPLSFAKEPYVCRVIGKKSPPEDELDSCRTLLAEEAFPFAKEP